MHFGSFKLGKILDIPKWQTLQDSLAKVTGLSIITADYKGIPITNHSCRRPFCCYIRDNLDFAGYCQKCDSRGGLEAVRIGKPYAYLCHCQIVDIAIPIIVDDKYIGVVMAGQIKLNDKSEEDKLERILYSPSDKLFNTPNLQKLYEDIPIISLEQLDTSVQMLFDLCNYVVEEAMNKNLVLDMYERTMTNKSGDMIPNGHSISAVENIRRNLGEAVTSAYIKTSSHENSNCNNHTLQPAFEYIKQHKSEMLSQKRAAELCHISSGHFSRLFVKETGEHYSNYYAQQKVEWSKQLLEKTDLSINQISDELGFSEPGYFIKTFRKYEGITPAAYRKYVAETGV